MTVTTKFSRRSGLYGARNVVRGFMSDEAGAITAEWMVLTAGVVGLAVASVALVQNGTISLSQSTGNAISSMDMGPDGTANVSAGPETTPAGKASGDDAAADRETPTIADRGNRVGPASGDGGRPNASNSSSGMPVRGTDSQRRRPRSP